MKHFRPVQLVVITALIAVYAAVRVWHLTDSCLWFDEIFSVHAAEHSWNSIISFIALDLIHPPLFYLLLKLWIGIGGEGFFWLRSLPVFLSILSLVPFVLFLRELKQDKWVEIMSLFLLAVNGPLIRYAQEVRMYSLLMCLSLFSMWLFARYFVKGKSFIPLVAVNVLLAYTHYFGWFVVLSEVAAIIIFQRIKWRRILMMFAIVLVSFLPWIIAVWNAVNSGSDIGQNIGWLSRPGVFEFAQFVLNLVEPFYYAGSSIDPVSIYSVSLPILLIVAFVIVMFLLKWRDHYDGERETFKLLGLFVVLPMIAAFAASWLLPYSIWGTRHMIVVFAPISILFASAIFSVSVPAFRIGALTLIVLLTGYAFVLTCWREIPTYSWCAWEPLTAHAAEMNRLNIYVFEDLVAYHVWFGLDHHSERVIGVLKIQNVDGVKEDTAFFLPRGFDNVKKVSLSDVKDPRLWVAYRADRIDETKPPLKAFIDRGYHIADRKMYAVTDERAIIILLEKQ